MKDTENLMKIIHTLVVTISSIVFAWNATAVSAAENPLRFVRALQDNGYGDMAVEYLNVLDKQPDLRKEIRDVWDLEMARSLKSSASAAFDAKEAEALMAKSQEYLAKFIKEKPDHPDAMIAMADWGDFLMKRALDVMRAGKAFAGKDQPQYEKSLVDTRAGLVDAQDKFQQAEKKFKARLAELPPASKLPTKKAERAEAIEVRERAEGNYYECQFQLALIDYYLAQTYLDPKNADRLAALKKAAQTFDAIYQQNRGSITGLYAHMWHGKTAEELDDLQTALDIYDEVLANAPEPTDKGAATGLEPLFTQVEHFRFIIVAKQKPEQFLGEASVWLKDFRRWKQTEGYQAIALDVAKAALAHAEKASPAEQQKKFNEILQGVNECIKVRSPYQQEFVAIRRDILQKKGAGADTEASSFEEAVGIGDGFVNNSEWEKGLEAYSKALAMAAKAKRKDPAGIAAVVEAMGRVQYMIARDLFNKGKFTECIEMVRKIVRDDEGNVKKGSEAAAQASALGVTAALNVYVAAQQAKNAEETEKSLDTLIKVAEFTETNWPDKPEADDARMARGQAKLVVGQDREAIELFDRVNPKSERYATAMYMAGMNYWRLYALAKNKADENGDKDQMAADRTKAVERLSSALDALKKQAEPGKPWPKYMLETQRLLAEVYNEGGQAQEAVALYQPLIDSIKAEKPKTLDPDTIRIFLGAVRAYSSLNDLDKAGEVGELLVELGPDTPQVNEALIGFAKLLNLERQKADAAVTELETTIRTDDLNAARAKLDSVQALLGKILVKMSQRQQLALAHMMFIGQTLNTVGMTAEATDQLQKILKRTETDPAFAQSAQKAMSLIRTELLKVLRKQEKFDAALKQVDQLIKDNPKALEPLMEKGRILEAWAEKDQSKFKDAVEHWAGLRNRLQPMKKKPDEYYEVMYNVAKCLVREAEKTKDKAKAAEAAKKAEQALKSPMILSPKLNGPDTVARYKALLNKAIVLQGRTPEKPEQKTEKKP